MSKFSSARGFGSIPNCGRKYGKMSARFVRSAGLLEYFVEGYVPGGERNSDEVIAAGERTATVPRLWLAFHLVNFERSEQSELFEAIAASRGIRVKFFPDNDSALAWLRANAAR